ncbi:MAG: hypothetical protein KQA33_00005, partial [Candidatus Aenigmarchaeota archaeon]|nr:hypothetical protein [Candidatus Aenigmarchaeota archaeon]
GPGITHKDVDIIQITVNGVGPGRDIFKNPEIPPAIKKYDPPNEPFAYECWAYPESIIIERFNKIDSFKGRKITEDEERELKSYMDDQLGYSLHNGLIVYKSELLDKRIDERISNLNYIEAGLLIPDWIGARDVLKESYPELWKTAREYVKKENTDVFERYYK